MPKKFVKCKASVPDVLGEDVIPPCFNSPVMSGVERLPLYVWVSESPISTGFFRFFSNLFSSGIYFSKKALLASFAKIQSRK